MHDLCSSLVLQQCTAKELGVPKIKTNKTASKRFQITGSGKLMRTRGGKSHLRRRKRPSVTRLYAEMTAVHSKDAKKVKRLLPNGL